jgi:hypothetical protein
MASDNRDGAYTQWQEALHPRHPAGTSQGGEFAPKTVADAERWARENLGIEADYGRNFQLAKQVNAALAEAKAKGVPMPKRVVFQPSRGSYHALFSQSNNAMAINSTAKSLAGTIAKDGYFSSSHQYHTVFHELGHMEHGLAVGERYDSIVNAFIPEAISSQVSRYAKQNGLEFVAETYAGLMAGRTYSEEVMRTYRLYGGVVR